MMASIIAPQALVEAASERTWMGRRRAHTGFLLDGIVLLGDDMIGDRSVGRDRSVVDRESDGGRERRGGV